MYTMQIFTFVCFFDSKKIIMNKRKTKYIILKYEWKYI